MSIDEQVPTTAEFALLSAARSNRLRRFYYVNDHVDAVTSAGFSSGGKVDTLRLNLMAELYKWLQPVPETSDQLDAYWKLTEAGDAARKRYLARPKGRRRN